MENFDFTPLFKALEHQLRLQKHALTRHYTKGEHLFRQGDNCSELFCLQQGLVKLYFHTHEGKEWVKSFIADQGVVGSRSSQSQQVPAPFSALCLEACTVVRYPYALFEEVCLNDAQLTKMLFQFTQWLGVKKEQREYQLLCLTAEEGYSEFLRTHPALACRLTQADISRYLGITPIGLSRIKRRLNRD